MSIVKCPYCNENVSDKARICPHCSKKLDSKKGGNNYWYFTLPIIILLLLLMIFLIVKGSLNEKVDKKKEADEMLKQNREYYELDEDEEDEEDEEEKLEKKKKKYIKLISVTGEVYTEDGTNYNINKIVINNNGDEDLGLVDLEVVMYNSSGSVLGKETVSPINSLMGEELEANSVYRLDNTLAYRLGSVSEKVDHFDINVKEIMFSDEVEDAFF